MHEHIPKNHLRKYVYKYDSFYNVFFPVLCAPAVRSIFLGTTLFPPSIRRARQYNDCLFEVFYFSPTNRPYASQWPCYRLVLRMAEET